MLGSLSLVSFALFPQQTQGDEPKSIPIHQLGAAAQKQYSGDGLAITPLVGGAVLRADFQRLAGRAAPDGLWLQSTEPGAIPGGGIRVRAMALGRPDEKVALASEGAVSATTELVAWRRDGVVEEYSVSLDGIRQDFVVPIRPAGSGDLVLSLELTGALAEKAADGARLIVEGTGRELAYHRLRVSDAAGRVLPARFEVTEGGALDIRVEDRGAAYPVRIDPTFADSDWSNLAAGIDGVVYALAVVGSDVYAAGDFSTAGAVAASCIAKWNGTAWSALGTGLGSTAPGGATAYALAVSGTRVYVGGEFTTAGGKAALNVAQWNGSTWAAVGPGITGSTSSVRALAVTGTTVYAGGNFSVTAGATANFIARSTGSSWTTVGLGLNGEVDALALSGTILYAGGAFTTTFSGAVPVSRVAKWDGKVWSALGVGTDGPVSALAVSGANLYAGGSFANAGGIPAANIARWDGAAWSALGTGRTGAVSAVVISGRDVYARGSGDTSGRWNGSAWIPLGSGLNGEVRAMAVAGGSLFVGGEFSTAGLTPAQRVARATIPPNLVITGNGLEIAAGDATPTTTDHTGFGGGVSGVPVTRTYIISNPGTAPLAVGAVGISGPESTDFDVTLAPASPVAAGGKTTFQVSFTAGAPGPRNAMISIINGDPDQDPFEFSIQGDGTIDSDTNGFTDYEETGLEALSLVYRVGDTVDVDLSFLGLTGAQKFAFTGLPPGVTFDALTQRLKGTITGEIRDGTGEIRKVVGPAVKPSLPFNFSVSPYLYAGTFEALIERAGLPVGKAKIVITQPRAYTATLEMQGQPVRSQKGSFSNPPVGGEQTVVVDFPSVATPVTFVLPLTEDLVTGSQGSDDLRGFRLAKPGRSPVQRVTVAFEHVFSGSRATIPAGVGYATGAFSSAGAISLRTVLGDGQATTLALNLSQTNQAVVFAQPYPDKTESFFGGILTIGDLGTPGRGGSTETQPDGLQWRKKAIATSKSYRGGFGPLEVIGSVSRWLPVVSAQGLGLALGLDRLQIEASYDEAPPVVLPEVFVLRNTLSLYRVSPAAAVPWSGRVVPSVGTFSGRLSPPGAPAITVSGVFLQDGDFLNHVGLGLLQIPISGSGVPTGSFETARLIMVND